MTVVKLLDDLKAFCEKETSGFLFPTALQKGDTEIIERAPVVHRMRLPDSSEADKKAPYIIIQFTNGATSPTHTANMRLIFCVYNDNEEEGAIMLANVIERVKSRLLETVVIGGCFKLDAEKGIESLIYTDDTAPYYAGEMMATFFLPEVHRKEF